jgi:uncharacterized membrane protein
MSYLDKRLARLRSRRAEMPEYNLMARNIASQSGTLNELTKRSTGELVKTGASAGAIINAQRQGAESISDSANDAYRTAQNSMDTRLENNSAQIGKVEDALAAEKEQKRKEKQLSGKNFLQIGASVLGAGIGTLIAPGVGTALGASLGASVGQMGSSFMPGGTSEDLMQGFQDTVSGISAASTLKTQKNLMADVGKLDLNNMSSKNIDNLKLKIATGDIKSLREFLASQYANPAMDELRNMPLE